MPHWIRIAPALASFDSLFGPGKAHPPLLMWFLLRWGGSIAPLSLVPRSARREKEIDASTQPVCVHCVHVAGCAVATYALNRNGLKQLET